MNSVKEQKLIMVKPRIRTQYNRQHWINQGEVNNQPSMTVPDETIPIRELLQRFTSGAPLPGAKEPIYEGEESTLPLNWEKMDISERADYLKQVNQVIQEHQDKTNKKLKEDEQRKRQEEIDKAVQAKLKELEKSQGKTASPQSDQG